MNMSLVSPKSKNPLSNLPRFVAPVRKQQKPARQEVSETVKAARVRQGVKADKIVHEGKIVKKKVQPAPHSGSERYLKGKTLPGFEQHGEIKEVIKKGVTRSVKFADGTVRRVPKEELVGKFNESLRRKGMAEAMENIKVDPETGKATVKIGGQQKGIEHSYSSVKRAQAAIRKSYAAR